MREKLRRYICLVFIPSPALSQKNEQASDWVSVRRISRRRRKHLHLRGVELTRFALFYCFLVREKLGLHRYIYLVFIPSPALLQKNKQAFDWVDAEENMPPIGTLSRKHLDLSVVELTRCVFRGLRLGGKSSYLYNNSIIV